MVLRSTVRGTFHDEAGAPLADVQGSLIPTPARLLDAVEAVTTLPDPYPFTTDDNGTFVLDVIATDDPDVSPINWTYAVRFENPPLDGFHTPAPAGTVVDLTTATPVDESAGESITRGPQGEPGLIQTIGPGDGITVDDTDPANPVVSADVAQDTGWRDVATLLINGWTQAATLRARLRRYGPHVQLAFYLNPSAATDPICFELPPGFRDYDATGSWVTPGGTATGVAAVQRTGNAVTIYGGNTQSNNVFCSIDLMTTDPWPTTLPGTPA